MSIEIVLLTPVLVTAIVVIAAGARYVDARGQTTSAAFAAARAASLTGDQDAAVEAGRQAAQRALAQDGHPCSELRVDIDTDDFEPGGDIRATVTCIADLADLAGLGLPGSKTFSATATVPIDQYRDLQ